MCCKFIESYFQSHERVSRLITIDLPFGATRSHACVKKRVN
jgi:hypothetical protein